MEPKLVIFNNENPTKVEEKLFHYAGYYVSEKSYRTDGDFSYIKYVSLYTEADREHMPKEINISTTHVDFEQSIEFFCDTNTLRVRGIVDQTILGLIMERIRELGWNKKEKN